MGSLQWEAVKEALRKMKPERKKEVEKAFAKADKDGSGTLSINEFMAAMQELSPEEEQEDMKNKGLCEVIISAVDGDGDKAVTLEELMKVIDEDPDEDDVDMTVNMIIRMCSHDASRKIKPDELIS